MAQAQTLATVMPPVTEHRSGSTSMPAWVVATLAIENMHCGGCMHAIERALIGVAGVQAARANLSAKRVAVTYDPGRVGPARLIDALDGAGFRAADMASAPAVQEADRDRDLLKRLAVAGFAAANIMLLSVSVWAGHGSDMDPSLAALFHWLSAVIALPAVGYSGMPFFKSAAAAVRGRRLNMDVPISLAITLATVMSLFQTLRGTDQVYFDAAVMLLFFLLIGRFLDSRLRTRAASVVQNLLSLKAGSATVLRNDGTSERLPAHALRPGWRFLVSAGERIAADGLVRTGTSDVDNSLITGESLPKLAGPGASVFSGTLNLSGPIEVEATATGDATLLAEIARLVQAAEQGRGRYVRLADRAARLYAPAVHILGLATFTGWMLSGAGWEAALTAAIAVLIITCPCALALAVPAVQVAAASRLFAKGIIVKAPDGLERLAETDAVVFDKTGTLTLGRPRLINGADIDDADLERAASLALSSQHPYSRAVVAAARLRHLRPRALDQVVETAGGGLSRETEAGPERLGSAAFTGMTDAGAATLWYRGAGSVAAAFRFEDKLRSDAAAVVAALTAAGYRVELLSGDREQAVAVAAAQAGIASWRSQHKPDAKIGRLLELAAQGRRTLMVGDGLNDAPALAQAHASLSTATAADISQTAADAIFQGEPLAAVIEILAVARRSRRLALQNFALAVAYNVMFVPLAMSGRVTPLIAALAMSTSSIAVTANAVRLKSARLGLRPLSRRSSSTRAPA